MGEEREFLGATNYLANGLWLGNDNGFEVLFRPDGTLAGEDLILPIWEWDRAERGLTATVMVSRVTGHVRLVGP
jgi:hypothetical protein